MEIVTVDSSANHFQLESIPLVDLRFLSQSELNSLSHCSDDAFDLRRCDDVVIPKIDRSVFNESAGSRKQTYSRLRLAPRETEITSVGRRGRRAGLLPIPNPPSNPVDDPERKENKQIATLLRELFARDTSVAELIPVDAEYGESVPVRLNVDNGVAVREFPVVVADSGKKKRGRKRKNEAQVKVEGDGGDMSKAITVYGIDRKHEAVPLNVGNGVAVRDLPVVVADGGKKKRGRKRKNEAKPDVQGDGGDMSKAITVYGNGSSIENQAMEIVNRNGVAVDIAALANSEDPFGPELKRRTIGLETETELLEFLKGLNGKWGSRRKKRRIVDACDFGDALPKGWKLLLGLKRKEGRVWLNCRRYISPNGQQFVSCKEVSSFLLSFFGHQDASQRISGHSDENTQQVYKSVSGRLAGVTYQDDNRKEDFILQSTTPITSISNDHEKQVALLGVENLAEVKIQDLLECQRCNMAFEEKDAYLQHLLSSHQRSVKRCRFSSSITEGVIIKDGKYECQFCHKIFNERNRYNGHVGVHVRNSVRSHEVLPDAVTVQKSIDPSSLGGVPSCVSKMDASVDIDKGLIPETSTVKPNNELNVGDAVSIQKTATGVSNYELNVSSFHSKQVTEAKKGSISETSTAKLNNDVNVGSFQSKLDAASIQEASTAKLNNDLNVSSFQSKLEAASIQETSNGGSSNALNVSSFHSKQVTEANNDSIPETSAKFNDEQSVGSLYRKLDPTSIQETPTCESNYAPNVSSSHSEQVMVGNNVSILGTSSSELNNEQSFGYLHSKLDIATIQENRTCKSSLLNDGLSHGEQDTEASEIEKTFVDETCDKLDCDSKMPDVKLEMVDEGSIAIDAKISSCLDSGTALSNNDQYSIPETFYGKDGFACTAIETEKYPIDQERCSGTWSITLGNEQICGVEDNINDVITSTTEDLKLDEVEKYGNNGLGSHFGSCGTGPGKDGVTETTRTTDEENVLQNGMADFSFPLMQSSCCFPHDMISHKGEDEFCSIKEKLDSIAGFEELRFDDIEPPEPSFVTGKESSLLPKESMDLAYDADLEEGLDSSVQFEREAVLLKMASGHQFTTICIWCRMEFNHEADNSETKLDSVGFMCPTCKSKISGQLGLDNDLSMNSDQL